MPRGLQPRVLLGAGRAVLVAVCPTSRRKTARCLLFEGQRYVYCSLHCAPYSPCWSAGFTRAGGCFRRAWRFSRDLQSMQPIKSSYTKAWQKKTVASFPTPHEKTIGTPPVRPRSPPSALELDFLNKRYLASPLLQRKFLQRDDRTVVAHVAGNNVRGCHPRPVQRQHTRRKVTQQRAFVQRIVAGRFLLKWWCHVNALPVSCSCLLLLCVLVNRESEKGAVRRHSS